MNETQLVDGGTWTQECGIAVVTLDRDPVNAMTNRTYSAMANLLTTLEDSGSIKVVVLTGAGQRAFCAGTDLSAFADEELAERTSAEALRFFELLARYPLPLVGALNGPAVGGGAMIASSCDFLIAVEHVYFSLPEVQLGLIGAASHAKQMFSAFQVKRMALLGERISAAEAEVAGILRVVEPARLLAQAIDIATIVGRLNVDAVRETLSILREPESTNAIKGYRTELSVLRALTR